MGGFGSQNFLISLHANNLNWIFINSKKNTECKMGVMGGLWPGFLIQGNRRLGPKNVTSHIFWHSTSLSLTVLALQVVYGIIWIPVEFFYASSLCFLLAVSDGVWVMSVCCNGSAAISGPWVWEPEHVTGRLSRPAVEHVHVHVGSVVSQNATVTLVTLAVAPGVFEDWLEPWGSRWVGT